MLPLTTEVRKHRVPSLDVARSCHRRSFAENLRSLDLDVGIQYIFEPLGGVLSFIHVFVPFVWGVEHN